MFNYYNIISGIGNRYFSYVEKQNTDLEGYSTFLEALKVTFSFYFILNLKYPQKFDTTLEFLQRCFLKIHPDAGSKTTRLSATKKKVFNFLNKFQHFDYNNN